MQGAYHPRPIFALERNFPKQIFPKRKAKHVVANAPSVYSGVGPIKALAIPRRPRRLVASQPAWTCQILP